MQRRLIVMDGNLVRHAPLVTCFIKKHNAFRRTVFHEGAGYQDSTEQAGFS